MQAGTSGRLPLGVLVYRSSNKINNHMTWFNKPVNKNKNNPDRNIFFVSKPRRAFLSWPAVVFVLLLIGVLLTGWTFQAGAEDIEISGRVPANALTDPAVITNVSDGSRFSELPIHLIGTCPLGSYVSIYTNDLFRGSVLCSGTGNFEIDVNLFSGQNSLSARAYNITDDEGPRSPDLTVYYDPPATQTSTNSSPDLTLPLTINTNHKYKGATVGQVITLTLEISGGQKPYALSVDWGDGRQDLISRKDVGEFTTQHIYKKAGSGDNKSFIIKITAADAEKTQTSLQVFIIINPSGLGSIIARTIPSEPAFLKNHSMTIWVVYAVIVLMAISYYLGEREELIILNRRQQ